MTCKHWKVRGVEYIHQVELKVFHLVFAAGNWAGLYDALCYCKETSSPIPKWVLDAVIVRQREFLFGENKRHAKWQRQFRQDMRDRVRAELVNECRNRRAPLTESYHLASRMLTGDGAGGHEAIKKSHEKYEKTKKLNPHRYYVPRYIDLREWRTLIDPSGHITLWDGKEPALDPEDVKWLDKKFPFPKDGGPRRYRRS